jgi:hypothetical protein
MLPSKKIVTMFYFSFTFPLTNAFFLKRTFNEKKTEKKNDKTTKVFAMHP